MFSGMTILIQIEMRVDQNWRKMPKIEIPGLHSYHDINYSK